MSDQGITAYALVVALLVSGGVLAQLLLDILRHGLSLSWWLLAYALTAAILGTLAFFVSRQGGRYMRSNRHR